MKQELSGRYVHAPHKSSQQGLNSMLSFDGVLLHVAQASETHVPSSSLRARMRKVDQPSVFSEAATAWAAHHLLLSIKGAAGSTSDSRKRVSSPCLCWPGGRPLRRICMVRILNMPDGNRRTASVLHRSASSLAEELSRCARRPQGWIPTFQLIP